MVILWGSPGRLGMLWTPWTMESDDLEAISWAKTRAVPFIYGGFPYSHGG